MNNMEYLVQRDHRTHVHTYILVFKDAKVRAEGDTFFVRYT